MAIGTKVATEQYCLSEEEIRQILSRINYDKPTWQMRLMPKGDGYLFQWTFMERDLTNPNAEVEEEQRGRKWYISPYMTDSEIIRTVFLAVQQAEMHEIAERFTYLNKRIFDPHMDYNMLAYNANNIGVDNRIPKKVNA